jgi:hypothetical protein
LTKLFRQQGEKTTIAPQSIRSEPENNHIYLKNNMNISDKKSAQPGPSAAECCQNGRDGLIFERDRLVFDAPAKRPSTKHFA